MGAPKRHGERITTAVRIPVDLHARLREEADDRDSSVNHLIVKAAAYYLDNVLKPFPDEEMK